VEFVQGLDDGLQAGAFPAQRLGFFGIVPDIWVFQFPAYLFETVALVSIVKDTP
jgi:hypothetical protein